MNKAERIKAAIDGKTVDRIPCSVWMHFSKYDQDPRSLAEHQVAFNEKYDFDFIKLMPFGAYSVQDWGSKIDIYCDQYKEPVIVKPGIACVEDYEKIYTLPGTFGTLGKTVQLAQHVSKMLKDDTPFIQTVFSPATTLKKLAYNKLFDDMRENPKAVHTALQIITETTVNFVKENLETGVSGFFFASQLATRDFMTDELYEEFVRPYDLQVLNAYKDKTWFNVLHIHGKDIMFDEVKDYPVNVLNWHDRDTKPSLKEARERTTKAFLGGIHEVPTIIDNKLSYKSVLATSTAEAIKTHVKEAIAQVDGKGIIIAPGCVCDPRTPEENLHAVREATIL